MSYRILQGDVLERLREMPESSVHCVVTSPPYWGLRDYGMAGQIGLEATPEEFIAKLVQVFREVRRVLRPDGTCWVNMGDAYAGGGRGGNPTEASSTLQGSQSSQVASIVKRGQVTRNVKAKDLIGQPWMLAFALRADGWYLRQDIIWAKPNPMPESVTDRCTKAHEYIFLLTKSARYFYDAEAIKEFANGWNGSEFDDGKNLLVHPNVGKNRAHRRGPGNKTHRGTAAYEAGAEEHRTKGGLVAYAERQRAIGVGPKAAPEGSGTKYNESFSAAVTDLVQRRNKRSVWEIATEPFPEAHFATFPTELVKPCILAGTSEKGCCARCGAPLARKVAPSEEYAQHLGEGKRMTGYDYDADRANGMKATVKLNAEYVTTGWRKACECLGDDEPTPCTVLDPFSGAGTTGLVAVRLGRQYLGIELNPEYVAMSERRLRDDRPLFAPPIAVVPVAEQISFDGVGH